MLEELTQVPIILQDSSSLVNWILGPDRIGV